MSICRCYCLLDSDPFREASERVSTLELFKLNRGVLVYEFINGQEATTDFDLDLVSFYLDHDALRTEFINTFGLTHEHDFKLLSIWVVVYVLCQFLIYRISLSRDVDGNSCLQIDYVRFEGINFFLTVFKGLKQIKRLLLGFIALLLNCLDEICGRQDFLL